MIGISKCVTPLVRRNGSKNLLDNEKWRIEKEPSQYKACLKNTDTQL